MEEIIKTGLMSVLLAAITLASCATTSSDYASGKHSKAVKKLAKGFTGPVDVNAVLVRQNTLGQTTYTTTSVMRGTKPVKTLPEVLLSDTFKDGIRIRFYYQQASEKTRKQAIIMAEKLIPVLAQTRDNLWVDEPPYSFSYNIYLIDKDQSFDGEITKVFRNNSLDLSFFSRALPIERNQFFVAGTIAHETFHLMGSIQNKTKTGKLTGYSSTQKSMFNEASASLFGACTNLMVDGEILLSRKVIATINNSNNKAEERKGSFNDHMLGKLLEPGLDMDENYAKSVFGPMLFTTLWAEYAGQATIISASDPAAKKFIALCEKAIWPPEKLIPVLQEMADDGIDPPELGKTSVPDAG